MSEDDTTTRTEAQIANLARERDAERRAAVDAQRIVDNLTIECARTTLDWYRAECLAAEAMAAGLAECDRLRKVLARWREALLCNATECSECYRPATWERLAEDDEGTSDDGVIGDLRCDHHKPVDGEWIERAFVEELRTLGGFAEARVERMKTTAMQVFEEVRAKHAPGKDDATGRPCAWPVVDGGEGREGEGR